MNKTFKRICLGLATSSLPIIALAADSDETLGGVAAHITHSFSQIGQLMIATAYIAGIGFTIAAIFKFKQHKDNPTQIPVGTPLAMLAIGILLIFLPSLIAPAGSTIFGGAKTIGGGFEGGGAMQLPDAKGSPSK